MQTTIISYQAYETECKGYLAFPNHKTEKPPVVLIAPTWEGVNEFAKNQAHALAKQGYAAFVVDLYGNGRATTSNKEAEKLMAPLFLKRSLLRERIIAGFNKVKSLTEVDSTKIVAIGFCFGGLTVIELMRSGADLNGVVSIHGSFAESLNGKQAEVLPSNINPSSSFLLLHGYKDPLAPMKDVLKLQEELSAANIDWQMHIYGSAAHAFTNPEAYDKKAGMYFDPSSCTRSMNTLHTYLKERFHE